jgi:DNA-binding MarR family transcriptional regulator
MINADTWDLNYGVGTDEDAIREDVIEYFDIAETVAGHHLASMVKIDTGLDPRHIAVLAILTEREANTSVNWVEAGTTEGTFTWSTLDAMSRRGLVEMGWSVERMTGTSNKRYRIARLTDQGREAYAEFIKER